jgi:acetyl esterase/lipase
VRVVTRAAVCGGLLLFAALGALAGLAGTAGAASRYPAWSGTRTVTYCDPDGQPLAMTLFAPDRPSAAPVPVVLQVHGGGWVRGERFTDLSGSATASMLTSHGFAVASVDYRLAPEHPWPDQIVDVKCAVRYLRSAAAGLGLDPGRIGAWGSSAGGQLVALLGTTGTGTTWNDGEYPGVSSAVEAVVDQFGPSDLLAPFPRWTAGIIDRVFGPEPAADSTRATASPLDHATPGDPPFLIQQGTADRIVPEEQSVALADRLRADGVHVELTLVERGPHGLGAPDESPDAAQLADQVTDFFVRTLGPSG